MVSLKTHAVVERSLAPAGPPSQIPLHSLQSSKDGKTVYALVADGSDQRSALVVLNAASAGIRATYHLTPGLVFHSLALGPTSHDLYLFGNRLLNPPPAHPPVPSDVIVEVLDPATGRVLHMWTARQADGHDWYVYQGLVSADERRLYISYHGFDTTGIDSFTISGDQLIRCTQVISTDASCVPHVHGAMMLFRDGLLAAQGYGPIAQVGSDGRIERQLDSRLEGNHLMEFAVDAKAGKLYAVGSCFYIGGLSVVDLGTGQTRLLVRPHNRRVCGDRLALGPGHTLIVGKATAGIGGRIVSSLLLVDARNGKVRATFHTAAEPLDLLVAKSH